MPFPRQVTRHLSLVVGILVGLAFCGYVVASFTGALGGSSDQVENAGASTSPSPTPTTTVETVPRVDGGQGKAGKAGKGGSAGKSTGGDLPGLGTPSLEELSKAVQNLLQADPQAPPARFTVSSLNLLGASHTSGGGNKPQFAAGPTRMAWALQLIRGYDVDVVGLQEFESTQLAAFNRLAGGTFDVYPGSSMGRGPVRQSIAWRTDTWKLVSANTIPIPYFHGHRIPMPYVLLQHRESGQGVYFFNVHNPATTKRWGNNQRWRIVAAAIEAQLVRRLQATGVPVIFTGDFNEKAQAYCKMRSAGLHAANGAGGGNGCSLPPNSGIDWIFGSPQVEFSNYVRERGSFVRRTTDHPMIVADAEVTRGG